MEQDAPTKVIADRVRDLRTKRGWSGADLAAAMRAVGIPWERVVVAKLESGRRATVSPSELLALAYVLNVAPVHLMVPPDDPDAPYVVTPEITRTRAAARAWIRGVAPVDDDMDWRQFFAEVPREEFYAVQQSRPRSLGEPYGVRPSPPVVAAVVTSARGVLIGRRNDRTPPWTFIAGEQEPGERLEDTIVREVKEETGLEIRAGNVIGERDHPATGRHMVYLAARPAGRSTKVAVGDEAELAEVRWASLAEADELLPGMFGRVREYLARELGG